MSSQYRRFDGRAQARSGARQAPSAPQLVPSDTSVGIRPSRLETPILHGLVRRIARLVRAAIRNIQQVYRGVHRRWEDTRDSWTRQRGKRPAFGLDQVLRAARQQPRTISNFRSQEIFCSQENKRPI